jgi:hypothetical protein
VPRDRAATLIRCEFFSTGHVFNARLRAKCLMHKGVTVEFGVCSEDLLSCRLRAKASCRRMFLRQTIRKKDGKERRYFSVVENKTCGWRTRGAAPTCCMSARSTTRRSWHGANRSKSLMRAPRGREYLHALAPGLTPRSVIEKLSAIQMIDVHVSTTDGRELVLTRPHRA